MVWEVWEQKPGNDTKEQVGEERSLAEAKKLGGDFAYHRPGRIYTVEGTSPFTGMRRIAGVYMALRDS